MRRILQWDFISKLRSAVIATRGVEIATRFAGIATRRVKIATRCADNATRNPNRNKSS
ncbi:hypothetical protein [Evansella clarkii]|uniref:hypothetical protein n=1 Tax=Evansella clarkii TaxID=79879 RepID=UPI001473D5A2|nr:hypothetical protein [Evansella clarkii]